MGSTSSSQNSSRQSSKPPSKSVIDEKLRNASKTGVLNLAQSRLSSTSKIWCSLIEQTSGVLKTLDISGNSLTELPSELLSLSSLKTLHADGCSLRSISSLQDHLFQLKSLTLSKNELASTSFHALPLRLTLLDVSFNRLNCIPIPFTALLQLVDLNLDSNQIDSLTGIGCMLALEILSLNGNNLKEIPEETSQLTKLKILSLKQNKLTKFSVALGGQCIPSSFLVNTAVEHIALDGNNNLRNSDVCAFVGIDEFLERRRRGKDKQLAGGVNLDHSLFGLD